MWKKTLQWPLLRRHHITPNSAITSLSTRWQHIHINRMPVCRAVRLLWRPPLLQLGIIRLLSSGMIKTVPRMLRGDAFISKLRFIARNRESQQTPLGELGNQFSGGFCAVFVLCIFTSCIYHTPTQNCYCLLFFFILWTKSLNINYCLVKTSLSQLYFLDIFKQAMIIKYVDRTTLCFCICHSICCLCVFAHTRSLN